MKTKNKYLNNKRLKILKLAKLIIAEEGLNSNTFETIALKHNLDINEINLLFPDGNKDFLEYSLEQLNTELQRDECILRVVTTSLIEDNVAEMFKTQNSAIAS